MNALLERFSEQQTLGFFLVLGRVGPLFVFAPMFASKMIPARARGVCALALAVGISPLAVKGVELPLGVMDVTGLMMKEILIGLAFAFAVGAVLAAVSVAGSFLDTFIGYSFGALVDPLTGSQSSIISQLYALVGVMVFIGIGGDAMVIEGLARTYELVGVVEFPNLGSLVSGVRESFVGIFIAALQLSAPIIIALVLTDAGFGLLSRVVPQLNVFAVGFPVKMAVGLGLIIVSMPFAAGWMSDGFGAGVADALKFLQVP